MMNTLLICLGIRNVASYFDTRTPATKEQEECYRIALTYLFPEWSPHDKKYASEESTCTDDEGYAGQLHLESRISSVTHDEQNFLCGITAEGRQEQPTNGMMIMLVAMKHVLRVTSVAFISRRSSCLEIYYDKYSV
jgi:hypothetical protein